MSIQVMNMVWNADLPTNEKMVLLIIADHASDDGSNAWPSLGTIARKASLSPRQVQRLVRILAERGFIQIEQQAGGPRDMRNDRRPNRYQVLFDSLSNGVTQATPREALRGDIEALRGDIEALRGDIPGTYGVTPMSPKPSIEPSLIEPSIETLSLVPVSDEFDRFWRVYPIKAGKRAAQRAWVKARATVDADTLIAGATRYAQDPNRDPAYTKHAATWLNAGCWDDEPIPARLTNQQAKSQTRMANFLHFVDGPKELNG